MRRGKLVTDVFGPSIEGPADEIVNDAWDAETPAKMVKLARKALETDLNAIDAYNILGIHAATLAERIALFREGDQAGEVLFEPLFEEEDMHWWSFIGTRPWMRARHNLGLALLEAGDIEEATTLFKSLVALNPNDNQGIRYVLLKLFAETGKLGDCKVLFDLYPDDSSIEFPSTKLLFELSKAKPRKNLAPLLAEVESSNAHFLPLLRKAAATGRWPSPPRTEYVAFGSKQQAELCLCEFREAWTRVPRILEHLNSLPSDGKK